MSSQNGVDCHLSVEHFRTILSQKTSQLTQLCNHWSKIAIIIESDDDVAGSIRSTVGQAKLLMSQRFKQFSDLIDNCEFNKGPQPTRLDDLLGFWEMIEYQVEDVFKKFRSLDETTDDPEHPR